jgi:hypothetical protein
VNIRQKITQLSSISSQNISQKYGIPIQVLVLALRRAPGDLPPWWRDSMTKRELREIGRE